MPSLLITLALIAAPARAEFNGVHYAHPMAWMHQPPVGEPPGWSRRFWMNLELNQANTWAMYADFTNLATGHTESYEADFEQSSAVLELGLGLSEHWALALEVPYADRDGGFMDDAIDQFHVLIKADRFLRNRFGEFGNHFILQDDGEDTLSTPRGEGVGSAKLKVKYWPLQWRAEKDGGCECGVSFSAQIKAPLHHRRDGMSSGSVDASVLAHVGVPLGRESGVWFTTAYTRLGPNPLTAPWPMRRDQQMYELDADIGLHANFGMVLQVRTESPLMNVKSLRFDPLNTDWTAIRYERIATAWNSLVFWRSYQAFGVRWRWSKVQQINLLATEDFGTGARDNLGTAFYSNNAPDFGLLAQVHLGF